MQSNDEIFASHPAKILAWLHQWLREGNPVSLPSEINWLELAETGAANACSQYRKCSITDSLLWGNIAITIREELAKNNTSRHESSNTYASAMMVRTNLIVQFGSYAGDAVCDAQLVIDWFYKTLNFSFEESERLIKLWPDPEASGNFEFKMVFWRLDSLQCLYEAQRIVPDEELKRWLQLWKHFEEAKKNSSHCQIPDMSQIKFVPTSDLF